MRGDPAEEVGGQHGVGIEDDDDVAAGDGDAGVEGGGLPLLALADHPAGEGAGHLGGAVGRSVVDDDHVDAVGPGDTPGPPGAFEAADGGQRFGDDAGLVVGGDDDAEPQARGWGLQRTAVAVAGLGQGQRRGGDEAQDRQPGDGQ